VSVEIFKQGSDNWGYIISNEKKEALAVDPLDATLYLKILETKKLNLVGILATHYHEDHIAGIPELLKNKLVPVVGPESEQTPNYITHKVGNDVFELESFRLESHFLPGHSNAHSVYRDPKKNLLFVGDLLFQLGCGRVLDSEPVTLFESLQYLKEFPTYSEVYVGHDYREKNHRFCMQVDPKYYSALNLSDLEKETTLEMELWWNPFLRAKSFDEWWDLRQKRNNF
jgi:hydroxyacylglutathione hydrolase